MELKEAEWKGSVDKARTLESEMQLLTELRVQAEKNYEREVQQHSAKLEELSGLRQQLQAAESQKSTLEAQIGQRRETQTAEAVAAKLEIESLKAKLGTAEGRVRDLDEQKAAAQPAGATGPRTRGARGDSHCRDPGCTG